jgi:Cd2+/Zn2+-exporting ATPase
VTDPCCDGVCEVDLEAPDASAPRVSRQVWLLVAAGLAIGAGAAAGWLGWVQAARTAYVVSIALTIGPPAGRAWRSLRKRALDINALMVIAVVGAAILGEWLEAATVVWLFGVAQWLEVRSLDRASHAIRSLMTLAPDTAVVRREGEERRVPVDDVRVGELVVVAPGERLAVDGRVVEGESAVNEAPVTGEAWPVEKSPGDAVFAGSINGTGALDVDVGRPASDNTIRRIIRLVEEAQRRRAPIQRFVDRFARVYTPAVVVLAVALAVVPPLVTGADQAMWAYRALALLVVACPCALVISTPVSVVSGLTAAARAGVLIKGGAHLERLAAIRCVAFDKTGTLTDGRVRVTDVVGVDGVPSEGVLEVAAALESRSEHPIGLAIVDHAVTTGLGVAPGRAFRALPGLGAEATVAEAPAIVGSHRLFEARDLCTPSLHARIEEVERTGANPVLVSRDGEALGVIGFKDQAREGSREAIAALRTEGVDCVALLTGDRQAHADAIMAGVGLDEAHAGLLPSDKVARLDDLRVRQGPVAMVGDGVNDAPALAAADVGVAMGVAGTGVALETADVALMADDLGRLPFAIRLGRATLSNIRTNVALAIGIKLVFVVLAATGLATLWMAILADTGASLLVTANGLRLLRLRPAD